MREKSPQRIQLSRKKGFNLQQQSLETNGLNAVKVDRSTRWGNPFFVGRRSYMLECNDAEEAVSEFKYAVRKGSSMLKFRPEEIQQLRGKNLACWCAPDAEHCHADVLLELANR